MSTIKVNNLQDAGGGSNSTPAQIEQGRAKAWVNFDGTGTVAIRDDYNVSTITDNGTGDYTINLSNATGNSNGSAVASSWRLIGYSEYSRETQAYQASTTTINVRTWNSASSLTDHTHISIALFGDS